MQWLDKVVRTMDHRHQELLTQVTGSLLLVFVLSDIPLLHQIFPTVLVCIVIFFLITVIIVYSKYFYFSYWLKSPTNSPFATFGKMTSQVQAFARKREGSQEALGKTMRTNSVVSMRNLRKFHTFHEKPKPNF